MAVKIIRDNLSHDPLARARFFREAEVNSRLKHDYILPLFEFCEVEGRLFLVTPYILSGTLAQGLQAGPCQRLRCVNASPRWCGRQRISIGGVLFTATSSPAIFYALAPAAAPQPLDQSYCHPPAIDRISSTR